MTMSSTPRFILVTGLSGAGKSHTLKVLEDLGFYCVDNLPLTLLGKFAELFVQSQTPERRIALCVDARSGSGADLQLLPAHLDSMREMGERPHVLFLESADDVLQRRYSETRRKHPSSPKGSIEEGIQLERESLAPIRDQADFVIDTSAISPHELRERMEAMFSAASAAQPMTVSILSFGFKHGLPKEADLVFDVRFLPNPHYDATLRPLTGNDESVRAFVMDTAVGTELLARLDDLLRFLVPQYVQEGKSYLTIAIGCTGGRHRSVAVSRALQQILESLGVESRIRHRDIERGG